MVAWDALESDALRSFAVFAEHRNLTTAAAALHISQPALFMKIKKLAGALGVALYERDGRRLRLTAAGERLAAFALDSRRRADELLQELVTDPPTLTIAAGRGTFRWVIGESIRHIWQQGRRIHMLTADRDTALSALSAGRADLAVLGYDPPPPPLNATEVAAFPQVLVIKAEHRLAKRRQVRLSDLDGLDLVLPPAGRPHRRALERALWSATVSWQVTAEVEGWDLLVHVAELGIGATIVNGCIPVPAGLARIPIRDLPTVRYWATWRPQRHALVAPVLDRLDWRP
jgi:DNA-binding transcriptional LysR family regulator